MITSSSCLASTVAGEDLIKRPAIKSLGVTHYRRRPGLEDFVVGVADLLPQPRHVPGDPGGKNHHKEQVSRRSSDVTSGLAM